MSTLEIFWRPRAAFAARPSPAVWSLIMLLGAAAPTVAYVQRADRTALATEQLKERDRLPDDDDARVEAVERAERFIAWGLPVGAAGLRALWLGLCAALAFLLLRGPRPHLTFGAVLGAVALGSAPFLLADVSKLALVLLRGPALMDASNPLLSNPAGWLAMDARSSALGAALRGLDLFRLWSVAWVAMGLAHIARMKGALPWVAPVGVWAAGLLLEVAGAASRGT